MEDEAVGISTEALQAGGAQQEAVGSGGLLLSHQAVESCLQAGGGFFSDDDQFVDVGAVHVVFEPKFCGGQRADVDSGRDEFCTGVGVAIAAFQEHIGTASGGGIGSIEEGACVQAVLIGTGGVFGFPSGRVGGVGSEGPAVVPSAGQVEVARAQRDAFEVGMVGCGQCRAGGSLYFCLMTKYRRWIDNNQCENNAKRFHQLLFMF